jgi:hypothetical protein
MLTDGAGFPGARTAEIDSWRTKDWVLGKRLDEWDVEHVELYRLTRRH